jgi:hypothetical protein
MREIALQRQANLSLRQQLGQKVTERPPRRQMSMEEVQAWLDKQKALERQAATEETFRKAMDDPAHEG